MAQSHIKLTGGIGDGKVIQNTISQLSHGFSVGQAIRYNRIAATGTGTNKYEAALADSPENSEVVGIVTQVLGDSSFVLTYAGEVDISTFGGVFALDDDDGTDHVPYYQAMTTYHQMMMEDNNLMMMTMMITCSSYQTV